MKKEVFFFVATYTGDIRAKIKASGARTPTQLTASGDTEQFIQTQKGVTYKPLHNESFCALITPALLAECRKVGELISHKWIIIES